MIQRNLKYVGVQAERGLYDLFLPENKSEVLTVFVHGYMGYKDWGAWNQMCQHMYDKGVAVAKLNLTSNGTTVDNPTEFADLNRFANGGYYQELMDVRLFLDHLQKEHCFTKFRLMGHSRGGGIVLLAGLDERVREIHCLAPISSIEKRFPTGEALQKWKEDGMYYRKNGRTGQEMPHHYSQYEEYILHKDELDIKSTCQHLNKPVFVYHGELDDSVKPEEGRNVAEWSSGVFSLIKNTAHTFGAVEPWNEEHLPSEMEEILNLFYGFCK